MRRLRSLGLVGLTVFSCVLLLELTPRPHIPVVTDKLDQWQTVRSETTILFVGSSRIYRHLSPEIFDRSMGVLGHDAESFNLGVPAVKTPEMLRILREALEEPTPALRWVVLELDGLAATLMSGL